MGRRCSHAVGGENGLRFRIASAGHSCWLIGIICVCACQSEGIGHQAYRLDCERRMIVTMPLLRQNETYPALPKFQLEEWCLSLDYDCKKECTRGSVGYVGEDPCVARVAEQGSGALCTQATCLHCCSHTNFRALSTCALRCRACQECGISSNTYTSPRLPLAAVKTAKTASAH